MLPGTRRSMTKMSIDIPKSVRAINSKRRIRYAPILVVLLSGGSGRLLSSQTSSKRQPL